jgi:hypothetical protein
MAFSLKYLVSKNSTRLISLNYNQRCQVSLVVVLAFERNKSSLSLAALVGVSLLVSYAVIWMYISTGRVYHHSPVQNARLDRFVCDGAAYGFGLALSGLGWGAWTSSGAGVLHGLFVQTTISHFTIVLSNQVSIQPFYPKLLIKLIIIQGNVGFVGVLRS